MEEGQGVPPPGGDRSGGQPRRASAEEVRRNTRAQRGWLFGIQLALLLPFATTNSCGGAQPRSWSGVGFYGEPDHVLFAGALGVLTLVLLVWPWSGDRGPAGVAGLGVRAWLATLGAVVAVFGPFLARLFENPMPDVGWVLHGGAWAATALGATGLTAVLAGRVPRQQGGGPAGTAVLALLAAPLLVLVLQVLVRDAPVRDAVAALPMGLALVAPLALGGLALARGGGHAPAWWGAVAITLLVVLVAGFAR